ncbi:hypothetical protein RCOM_0498450 [Ricinus communis]|uniref:Uncharacterized protein n=1 Tax=Ricinus communis TaxID=3988 RepID=B9SWP4_RICCO|nr:hypothetical protein RCOM_0498450 [Ricinus communis]
MSAYAHQMEREYSAQSLLSRGGSEMGSHYVVESGFYMTSFAAIIFVGALVTVGVLFITLLIALTVMLQSCESRSKGIIEIQIPNDDYNYCKTFTLHAELNNLGPDDFPPICRNLAFHSIKESHYERDLNSTMWLVEKYFDSVEPLNDGLNVKAGEIAECHYRAPYFGRIQRLDDEMGMDSHKYFLKRRMMIQREGFRITGIISSQMDALIGRIYFINSLIQALTVKSLNIQDLSHSLKIPPKNPQTS